MSLIIISACNSEAEDYEKFLSSKVCGKGCDLSGRTFYDADLSGAQFLNGAKLVNTTFVESSLKDAKFDAAIFINTTFVNVDLKGAVFSESQYFTNLTLEQVELDGASGTLAMSGGNIHLSEFLETQLSIFMVGGSISASDFSGSNLQGSSFQNVMFSGNKFVKSNLQGSYMPVYLGGSDFEEANLRDVNFWDGAVDFTYVNLENADLSGSTINNPDFRLAFGLSSVKFENARISGGSIGLDDFNEIQKKYDVFYESELIVTGKD